MTEEQIVPPINHLSKSTAYFCLLLLFIPTQKATESCVEVYTRTHKIMLTVSTHRHTHTHTNKTCRIYFQAAALKRHKWALETEKNI